MKKLVAGMVVLMLCCAWQCCYAQERVALVIGNSAYRSAPGLINPTNDADDVSAALRAIGFTVTEGTDQSRDEMINALRSFSAKLVGSKIALFYYAGHGIQVNGKNYLVPIDAKIEKVGDLSLNAVDVQIVLDQMEAKQRVSLVFLDACRDNPFTRSIAANQASTRSVNTARGLAAIDAAAGTMIAYATQPDTEAADGAGRNSPFAAAFVNHVGDPNTDIAIVMRRVRYDVLAATSQRQVPWDHSSLTDAVVLAPATTDASQLQQTAAVRPPTASALLPPPRGLTGGYGITVSMAFSSDGHTLAWVGQDLKLKLWDAVSGQQLRTLDGSVFCVVFSPDGRILASVSGKTIKLWDAARGQLLRTLAGHTETVRSIAFSPDGNILASASEDKTVKLWTPANGQLLRTLSGHFGVVSSVVFSPDGQTLASASEDRTVKPWHSADGQLVRSLDSSSRGRGSIAFSPDGRVLATARQGEDAIITLWDTVTGEALRGLVGHNCCWVGPVMFSPDGRVLASGGEDATIRLWDPGSGKPLRTLESQAGWVGSLAFLPDEHTLAAAGEASAIQLWDLSAILPASR